MLRRSKIFIAVPMYVAPTEHDKGSDRGIKKTFNLSLSPATPSTARETVLGQLSKQSENAYETKSQNLHPALVTALHYRVRYLRADCSSDYITHSWINVAGLGGDSVYRPNPYLCTSARQAGLHH